MHIKPVLIIMEMDVMNGVQQQYVQTAEPVVGQEFVRQEEAQHQREQFIMSQLQEVIVVEAEHPQVHGKHWHIHAEESPVQVQQYM